MAPRKKERVKSQKVSPRVLSLPVAVVHSSFLFSLSLVVFAFLCLFAFSLSLSLLPSLCMCVCVFLCILCVCDPLSHLFVNVCVFCLCVCVCVFFVCVCVCVCVCVSCVCVSCVYAGKKEALLPIFFDMQDYTTHNKTTKTKRALPGGACTFDCLFPAICVFC
jgi:hypothetical protein